MFALSATTCATEAAVAASSPWQAYVDVGLYEIHRHKAEGVSLGLKLTRSLQRHGELSVGLSQGIGEDDFTILETMGALSVPLPFGARIMTGVGVGIMSEEFLSTVSGPYFAFVGVDVDVVEDIGLTLGVRRGDHINFADDGTFPGPDVVSMGFRFDL